MPTDPFQLLGVSSDVSPAELRAAFRRHALRHHPDRNQGDPAAAARFRKVLRAYREAQLRSGAAPASEAQLGPRPDRYECGSCGDRFPFPSQCSRCGLSLWDRAAGPAPEHRSQAVEQWMVALETRETSETPDWAEELPVARVLVATSLLLAAAAYPIGPVGVPLLFVGFASYIGLAEAQRVLSLRRT